MDDDLEKGEDKREYICASCGGTDSLTRSDFRGDSWSDLMEFCNGCEKIFCGECKTRMPSRYDKGVYPLCYGCKASECNRLAEQVRADQGQEDDQEEEEDLIEPKLDAKDTEIASLKAQVSRLEGELRAAQAAPAVAGVGDAKRSEKNTDQKKQKIS